MTPIQNPPPPAIGPNSDSDAVTNLQEVLLFLFEHGRFRLSYTERDALKQDFIDQSYREGTRQAVTIFRDQFRLEPGEDVDEPMAESLNGALEDLGAFDLQTQDIRHMAGVNGSKNTITKISKLSRRINS